MPDDRANHVTENVTLWNILISFALAAVGIGLLYWSANDNWWTGHLAWQAVTRQLGSLFLVSLAINVIWNLVGKRAFLNEILEKAQISKEISFSGIVKVFDSFHRIDWKPFFEQSRTLDIYIAYGRTWRNTHLDDLRRIARRHEARIRVLLPDYNHRDILDELARRFNSDSDDVGRRIREAETEFKSLCPPTGGCTMEVKLVRATPQYTLYLFDDFGILALYNNATGREPVPAFICKKGGMLYTFLKREFRALIETASSEDTAPVAAESPEK